MTDSFSLTPEQQRAWTALLEEKAPRGAKSKMATAIALAERKTDSKESWKSTLSGFFKGQAKELKALFDYPKRLRAAEEAMGLKTGQLRDWLEQVRSGEKPDGPLDLRVPGFEDYGPLPVLDAYFGPVLGAHKQWLPDDPKGQTFGPSAGYGGILKVDEFVKKAMPTTPAQAFALVFCGGPGIGKTPTLQALAARLQQSGVSVVAWHAGMQPAGGVVVCDDLDLLEPGPRSLLCKTVHDGACVLLTATASPDRLDDLPRYRAVYTLSPGYKEWALEYLTHLETLLLRHWNRKVSFVALREWIESDLFASALTDRLDNLGMLARHVAEGRPLPLRYSEIAQWSLSRATQQIRRKGDSAAALFLEQYGEDALQRVAASACLAGRKDVSMRTLLDALHAAISDVPGGRSADGGERPSVSVVLEAAELICQRGLFHRRGGYVAPTQQAAFFSALGGALVRGGQVDNALLYCTSKSPTWAEAVVAAAQRIGDGAPLLQALLDAPSSVLSMSVPMITRLLTADVFFKNEATYTRAFLLCLSFWARWPADPRSFTLTLGGPMNAAPPAPNQECLVSGHAPLLVLARASALHRRILPKQITAESVQSSQHIPGPLREYLDLMGHPEATAQQARDAIGLGAPFQTDALLDPELWQRLPPFAEQAGQIPGGFCLADYVLWWGLAAEPRLREFPDAISRLAGTHPDHSILSGMRQGPLGCALWQDALISRIRARDPRAPRAFAEAVLRTLEWGGRWNFESLRAIWEAVPGQREPLRQAVLAKLVELKPPTWSDDTILPWLLSAVVIEEQRAELWKLWSSTAPAALPWKRFLDAGLPPRTVVEWALAVVRDSKLSEQMHPTRFFHTGAENAGNALSALSAGSDVDVLDQLMQANVSEHSRAALARLCALSTSAARRRRLQIWLATATEQNSFQMLISDLIPEPGEDDLWRQVAQRETNPRLSIARWAMYALVAPQEDRWAEALAGLETIESQLRENPATYCHEMMYLLSDIASCVALAEQRGTPDPAPIVDVVFCRTGLRRQLRAGVQAPLWLAALRRYGRKRIVEFLAEDEEALRPSNGTQICLLSFTRGDQVEMVRELLCHPVLSIAAARALAQSAFQDQPQLLREALDAQPRCFADAKSPAWDPVVAPLLEEYLRVAPDGAIDWLTTRLSDVRLAIRRELWGVVIPKVPHGLVRERALAQYYAPESGNSPRPAR